MKKVLYVTCSKGFKHDCLEFSHEVMKKLGEESGLFEATCTWEVDLINAKDLQNFDAVVFCTTGELPISAEDKLALLGFVLGGKGFVGIHNATDTFYQWPEYGYMIGGYFNGHPWNQEVGVIVEDKEHPATKHLGDYFKITDEIYEHRDWSRKYTHVLLRIDNSTVDVNKPDVKRPDKDFAMAWCHEFGRGRVFYTGHGHSKEVWGDERFQKHLLGGILWVMRLA
jgi:type 1 glutamine amidotransferase